MFLPIGDSPNFKSTPWVTWSLIAANVLVFLVLYPLSFKRADPADPATQAYARILETERGVPVRVSALSAYDVLVFRFGYKPRFPELSDMMASMFLHGGWLHLLGNMLFLWIYGDNVEHRLGRFGYLLAYLGTGVAAAFGDALLRPDSAIPAVGASGAISGMLGFYFIWFPRNRVRVWIFLFPFFMDIVELPARLVLGIYLVIDNLLPALITGGQSGVAYGAHLGGFFAAVAAALLLDRLHLRRPEAGVPAAVTPSEVPDPGEQLRHALAVDDVGTAFSLVSKTPGRLQRAGIDHRDVLQLGERLADLGHPRAALGVLQRLLSERPSGGVEAQAHVSVARILWQRLGMPAEAFQHLVRAMEGAPSDTTRAEAQQLLAQMSAVGIVPRRWLAQ